MDCPFTRWIEWRSTPKLDIGVPVILKANHTEYVTNVCLVEVGDQIHGYNYVKIIYETLTYTTI